MQVVAPTDAQLRTIREMCEERGLEPPAVVASKQVFEPVPWDRGIDRA